MDEPENLPALPDDRVTEEARERAKKHLWKKGQSGNPAGRPKGTKNHLAQLKRDLETAVRENINPEAIKSILASVVARALEGDIKAAKLILDKFVTNASEGEEEQKSGGTFVFQVKNLTLKTDEPARNVIDITPVGVSEMSTGASQDKQSRTQDTSGGNLVGKAPSAPLAKVPDFMGKAGQSDNQSTNRPKGST